MKVYEKIKRAVRVLSDICALVSGICIFVMMFMITGDVILRNLFHISLLGVYELTQHILMPMTLLPAVAFVYRSGVLPKFEGLGSKGSEAWRRFIPAMIAVSEIIIFGILMYYSFTSAKLAWIDHRGINAAGRLIPTYLVYTFLPVGFGLMFLECVFSKIDYFSKKEKSQIEQ